METSRKATKDCLDAETFIHLHFQPSILKMQPESEKSKNYSLQK